MRGLCVSFFVFNPHGPTHPASPLPPPRYCRMVEQEVRGLCEGALWVAREVVAANRTLHERLSAELEREEKLEGPALQVGPKTCARGLRNDSGKCFFRTDNKKTFLSG